MRTSRRGAVFITTMICTLLMLMVGGSLYQLTAHEFIFTKHINNSLKAHGFAEAGLARALSTLNTDFNSKNNAANFTLTTLDEGTYDASVTSIGSRVLVSSVGVSRNISKTVSAEVIPPTLSALSYALASGEDVYWSPGLGGPIANLIGDIYGFGNVSLGGTINGNVMAGGTISGSTPSGSSTPNSTAVVAFPVVDSSFYRAIAQANGQYFSGNKAYDNGSPIPSNPAGGVIYVKGDISITHNQTTTACIFATGNITISRVGIITPNITINQYSNYPAMVALKNIAITSAALGEGASASLIATGLIYAGGNFDFGGDHYGNPVVNITGSIIARGRLNTSLAGLNTTIMTFQQQNPPGFTTTPNTSMTIASYNS